MVGGIFRRVGFPQGGEKFSAVFHGSGIPEGSGKVVGR